MIANQFVLFQSFLSHCYGSRSLPSRIVDKEFRLFQEELRQNKDSIDLKFEFDDKERDIHLKTDNILEFCYELDENQIPPKYRLKNLDRLLPKYNSNVNKDMLD